MFSGVYVHSVVIAFAAVRAMSSFVSTRARSASTGCTIAPAKAPPATNNTAAAAAAIFSRLPAGWCGTRTGSSAAASSDSVVLTSVSSADASVSGVDASGASPTGSSAATCRSPSPSHRAILLAPQVPPPRASLSAPRPRRSSAAGSSSVSPVGTSSASASRLRVSRLRARLPATRRILLEEHAVVSLAAFDVEPGDLGLARRQRRPWSDHLCQSAGLAQLSFLVGRCKPSVCLLLFGYRNRSTAVTLPIWVPR